MLARVFHPMKITVENEIIYSTVFLTVFLSVTVLSITGWQPECQVGKRTFSVVLPSVVLASKPIH